MNIHEPGNENTARRKLIVILLITIVFDFIFSYAINKLYTFSCFSYYDRKMIQIGCLLISIAYTFIAAKLSGITLEDMGFLPKLFRRYLFMLLPGVFIQLLRVFLGACTPLTGIFELFLFLLVAVSEELLFRGLMLSLLLKITHTNKYAILIQAVVFGLMHYFNAEYGTLSSCTDPMFFGAIFACIRIYLPEGMGMPSDILLHWVWDMCI